jgi:serine/threonine protein kinase
MNSGTKACLSAGDLQALLCEDLPEPQRSLSLDHLDVCPRCSDVFSRMASSWSLSDAAVGADPAGRNTLNFEQRLKESPPDLRPLPADVPEELPAIPGYDNLQLHASGGMATIYRARDAALGRQVAIKLLSSHAIHSRTGRQRALREARLLARLAHPGVVTIHATGVWQERPYLVLEWINGCTLQEKIDAGSLRPQRAAEIARDLAQTLIGLHDAGVIHRDLKPDNVLLAERVAAGVPETVKLIDFGLARPDDASRELTIGDTVLGTPSYMAAEQTGLDPDLGETSAATDLHGIGCLLFAMLTGQAPYKAASVMASLQRAVRGEVAGWEQLDDVPAALRTIVRRCLRPNPAERYRSAADLAVDLTRFLENCESRPVPAVRGPGLSRWPRTWWISVAVVLLVGVGLGTVAGPWGPWLRQPTPPVAATRQTRTAFKPVSAPAAPAVQATPVVASTAPAEETAAEPSDLEQMVLEALNREREAAGVPPLRRDERLSRGARSHASAMLREHRMFHLAPGESDLLRDRIAPTGYRCRVANQVVWCCPPDGLAGLGGTEAKAKNGPVQLDGVFQDMGVGVEVDAAGLAWVVVVLAVPAGS